MTAKADKPASLPVLGDAASVLEKDDQVVEYVDVPEWGVQVRVVSLTGVERDDFEKSLLIEHRDAKGQVVSREVSTANMRAKLTAASVRDEAGKHIFTRTQATELGQKNAAALDRIFRSAQRLSSLTDDDVEDLTQGFEQGPNDASGSA